MRKHGGKNANGRPDWGQQVSVIAQEDLKLAAFLFHHRWRTGVHADTEPLVEREVTPHRAMQRLDG